MERSRPASYGIAIASFAAAVALRGVFTPALGFAVPFITFFPAVIVSTVYGGLGAGLVTTGLSALAVQFFFLQPPFTFQLRSVADTLDLLLFLGVSIFLCILSERLRRTAEIAESHAAASEAAREQLNRETGQRVASDQQQVETRRWANDTLSSIGDGVICTDVDGNVTFMNSVAEQLTGWSNQEASGQPMMKVFRIINETTREPAVNPIGRVLTEGLVLGLANHTVLVDRAGKEIPIDDSGAPIRNARREIIGAVLVFRDISERKNAEETLQRTIGRLKRSNEDLAAFAHALSHDLQEPVRGIGTIAELLVRQHGSQLDEKAHKHLTFIIEGASRLAQMIRSLLTYARMVNAQEATMSSVRLSDAVNWAEANLHQLVSVSGAMIRCDDLPSVFANEVQIVQVFQNLLENAIKYRGSARAVIHIRTVDHPGEWEVTVTDNGIGIQNADQGEVFRLFRRGTTDGAGSGIGLAVCKRIVERHGGKIWVESIPGDGSTFHFTLSKDPDTTGV